MREGFSVIRKWIVALHIIYQEVKVMSHVKFFKHLAYSFFDMIGCGDYPDTDHIDCPDCGEPMAFHGDDINLPDGEEFWECPGCGFKFMISDFSQYECYYDELECPDCGGELIIYDESSTGQPNKWKCEDCGTIWAEDDEGDLVEED